VKGSGKVDANARKTTIFHRKAAIRIVAVLLLAAVGLASSGCGLELFFSWLTAPRHPKRNVPAEYKLEADLLLILPYAGTEILFDYPTAAVEVSQRTAMEVARHLRRRVKRIANPAQVQAFQDSNLDWPSMSLAEIGRRFGADKILYIELSRYTMMEPDSVSLLRGRISAKVEVADVAAAAENPAYSTDVDIVFPPDRPVAAAEFPERVIRQVTTRLFAETVVKKFYDHEEKVQMRAGGR